MTWSFEGEAPRVRDLLISADGKHMEVAANASPGVVRCIALEATDRMRCGTLVKNTGHSIRVPVGEAVLGPRGGRAGPPHRRAGAH